MRRALLLSALTLAAALSPATARAEGAIALGLPSDVARDGVAVGWAVRQPAGQASGVALQQCRTVTDAPPATRELCRVLRTFTGDCIAVAIDPGDGTPGFGWAIAASKSEADAAAMRACQETAGADRRGFCRIGASDCDRR